MTVMSAISQPKLLPISLGKVKCECEGFVHSLAINIATQQKKQRSLCLFWNTESAMRMMTTWLVCSQSICNVFCIST